MQPDQPTPVRCPALYPTTDRTARIVHCELAAGHDGDHEEVSTESSWPACCPGETLRGDPHGMHTHDCPVYLANVAAREASRAPVEPQPWPPQLPRPLTQADVDAAYQHGRREATIECNTEIDRLHALLEQAEQYARDLQDSGALTDEAREQGLAEGRRQATEGWERQWGVHGPVGIADFASERSARHIANAHGHIVVSRLVGPWETAEQPEPATSRLRPHQPDDVEVVETRSAQWMFRCHRCDITKPGLSESEAKQLAATHTRPATGGVVDPAPVPLTRDGQPLADFDAGIGDGGPLKRSDRKPTRGKPEDGGR